MSDIVINTLMDAVSTGDSRNLLLPIVIFAVCAVAAIAVLVINLIKK